MIPCRKGLIALLLFFLITPFCQAQKWRHQTDSLFKAYTHAHTPSDKVNLLCRAANIFLFQNPDTALVLCNEAEAIAQKSGDDALLATAYASKSAVYLVNDNNNLTLEYAVKGLKISEHTPLPNDILAALYRKFGYVYRNTNRAPEGIQYYKKALQYSAAAHNQQDMAATYSNIANLFVTIKQYDSALHYFDSALTIAKRIHFLDIIVRSYLNIINTYNGLHQYNKAFATVTAMEPYVNDAEQTPIVKGLAYTVIASLDLRHGRNDHPLATRYLDSMRHLIAITSPGNDNMVDYYLNRALLEFSNRHFDTAAASLETYNELKRIRDNEIMSGHAQELATRYETGKKEARIKELDEQSRLRQTLLIIALTASCIFLVLLFFVWQQNKKIKKQEGHLNYLMKELHHRVKNNLQIVSSLLSLQSLRIDDEQARKALTEGQHRIEAMSLIHQKLYQTKTAAA
jgi:tetratricopeptide (TPR) repeat protein